MVKQFILQHTHPGPLHTLHLGNDFGPFTGLLNIPTKSQNKSKSITKFITAVHVEIISFLIDLFSTTVNYIRKRAPPASHVISNGRIGSIVWSYLSYLKINNRGPIYNINQTTHLKQNLKTQISILISQKGLIGLRSHGTIN